MKKNILFTIAVFCFLLPLNAQTFEWARSIGGSSSDVGNSITKDKAENIYTTGFFNGTANFGNTTLTSVRGSNAFVAKYNPQGNLLWIRQAKGYSSGLSIASDTTGVYFVGDYGDTLTLDGGNNSSITLTASGTYIAKYDLNGNLLWAYRGFTGGNGAIMKINPNKDGSITIIGNFEKYVTLNGASGNITLNSPDNNSPGMFIGKYNNNGVLLWAKQAGAICPLPCGQGGNPNMIRATAISSDVNDNIFILGTLVGTVNFGTTPSGTYPNGIMFFAKFDSNGNFLWLKEESGTQFWDSPYDIKNDNEGNIYLLGRFTHNHMFLSKYDNDGNFVWSIQESSSLGSCGYALNVNANGNIFITGNFKGNLNFGGATMSSGSCNAFILKLNSNGNAIWGTKTSNLSVANFGGLGIVSNYAEDCFITGYFQGTVSIGDSTFYGDSYNQIFITKVKAPNTIGLNEIENNFSLNIYPNPTGSVFLINYSSSEPVTDLQLEIKNVTGQTIYSKRYKSFIGELKDEIDLGKEAKGIYFIELISGEVREVRKIIIE